MSLSISNLRKHFGRKIIFDNFSYTFNERGVYALCGISGIGKTTLLRIIAGLDTDFSGKVAGGGIGNVSFGFQEHRLFPNLSALENAVLANCDKMTEDVVTKAKIIFSDLGLNDSDIALPPSELSGGMRARVSLVRAFLKDAPVLLLDEPTKELDEANRTRVLEVIKREGEKRLVIMVTHNIEDAKFCNAELIKL